MKKRSTPLQEFVIRVVVNENHGDSPENSVEITSGQYGSIWIEDASDLLLLKNAIDSFISSGPSPILKDYLCGFEPAEELGKGVIMRTSADIMNDLADMDDLSIPEIADAMTTLGYRSRFSESGSHGWMLRKQ